MVVLNVPNEDLISHVVEYLKTFQVTNGEHVLKIKILKLTFYHKKTKNVHSIPSNVIEKLYYHLSDVLENTIIFADISVNNENNVKDNNEEFIPHFKLFKNGAMAHEIATAQFNDLTWFVINAYVKYVKKVPWPF